MTDLLPFLLQKCQQFHYVTQAADLHPQTLNSEIMGTCQQEPCLA